MCSTLLELFTFGIGNFLNDFNSKVNLILILRLSSLPRDLIKLKGRFLCSMKINRSRADTYSLVRAGVMQMARLQGSQDPRGEGYERGGKSMLVNWGSSCAYFGSEISGM